MSQGGTVQDFWRDHSGLHINIKELLAAINTIKSLAKPKETIHLSVDNVVAYSYLKRGGRIPSLNKILRPFLAWCQETKVKMLVNLVKSKEMVADQLSRVKGESSDCALNRKVFQNILQIFKNHQFTPEVDMFASPSNKQLEMFVSRFPHWEALACNALEMDLGGYKIAMQTPLGI